MGHVGSSFGIAVRGSSSRPFTRLEDPRFPIHISPSPLVGVLRLPGYRRSPGPFIPDAEHTIGLALLYANTVPTAASLVLAILSHGLDARDAIKAWEGDEDECGKKSKQEVGRTELALACLLAVRIILSSFFTEFHIGRLTNCVSA